ncbi:MAG TPA: glycerophosphodiester phosphodiesterase family protein [Terriglobales bacterium]|nr:glycerophosphodiester phosphodiesterase family protein [Terriglobales bacterium]
MRSLALACWVVGAAGVIATMMSEGEAQNPSATLLAAHRGGSLLWPENSLLAFRNAVALGADFIEFDVHLSRDGEVMVIHDATLDRTTTGSGPVKDRTAAELKAFRLKDRSGVVTQEAIPTLDEVVAVAAQGRRRMLLEIKTDPSKARYPGIEEKVLAILDRHAMAPSTIVMSFEAPTWRRVRELRPDIATCALYSARMLSGSSLAAELETLRAAGVGFIAVERTAVDAGAVAQAQQAGIGLGAWTANDPADMKRLIGAGVGILITDQPDAAKTLLKR